MVASPSFPVLVLTTERRLSIAVTSLLTVAFSRETMTPMVRSLFLAALLTNTLAACSSEPTGGTGGGGGGGAASTVTSSGALTQVQSSSGTGVGPEGCHGTLTGNVTGSFTCKVYYNHPGANLYQLEIRPDAFPNGVSGIHLVAQPTSPPFMIGTFSFGAGLTGEFDVNGTPESAAYQSSIAAGTATLVLTAVDTTFSMEGAPSTNTHGTLDTVLPALATGTGTGTVTLHLDF